MKIFVNEDELLNKRVLKSGDVISIFDTKLRFETKADEKSKCLSVIDQKELLMTL